MSEFDDARVHAAAKAWWESCYEEDNFPDAVWPFDDLPPWLRDKFLKRMRAALDAAYEVEIKKAKGEI